MTSSGPRYHIPFPTAFLSLNTTEQKSSVNRDAAAGTSPESEQSSHSFLSNRTDVPRHSSVSSVTSVTSTASTPSSPASQAADAAVASSAVPAFLTLNSKYAAAPAKALTVEKSNFLSNN